jgi:hypothetical protein
MLDLDKEAEEYAHNYFNMHETNNYKALKQGFIVGAESKYVQAKILEAQIDILKDRRNSETIFWLDDTINKLEEQLKELEQ